MAVGAPAIRWEAGDIDPRLPRASWQKMVFEWWYPMGEGSEAPMGYIVYNERCPVVRVSDTLARELALSIRLPVRMIRLSRVWVGGVTTLGVWSDKGGWIPSVWPKIVHPEIPEDVTRWESEGGYAF